MNAPNRKLSKSTIVLMLIVCSLACGVVVVQSLYARDMGNMSASDYPPATTAADIQDLLLRDALIELIDATKQANSTGANQESLLSVMLYSERVNAYYERFKVQHTQTAAERIKGPITHALQDAVSTFMWAKATPENSASHGYFMCLEQLAKKLGANTDLSSDSL
jgi:hypothetical protein